MLEISLQSTGLDDLDIKMRRAISKKMTQLTDIMYEKVIENLSGKILQSKSGELVSSIHKERTRLSEGVITGRVFVSPESPKAWALEKGGSSSYPIFAKNETLKFFWDKMGQVVYFPSVNHPASKEFGYLRHALEEMEPLVPERFSDIVSLIINNEGDSE
jgi:hypothetical protein